MQAVDTNGKNDKSRDWLYVNNYMTEYGVRPEIKRNGFLLTWLSEIGYYQHGAMGIIPISQMDIMAWRSNTGTIVDPEDVNLLMLLSKIYVGQYRRSSDANEPPPTDEEPSEADLKEIQRRIRASRSRTRPS